MDIGPAQALYPIVDHNFNLPPNALMHDVFNYMTNSPFVCVDSYALANASRSFYFIKFLPENIHTTHALCIIQANTGI